MIEHFNSEIHNFSSIFVRLKHMMTNKPTNKEFESEHLLCTILQFVVKLIS